MAQEDDSASADIESAALWDAFQRQAHAITLRLDEPRDRVRGNRALAWLRRVRVWLRWPWGRGKRQARPDERRQVEPHSGIGSPRDPELREALARLLAALEQAKRLIYVCDRGGVNRRDVLERMKRDSTALDLDHLGRDAANELADAFDRALIDIGDRVYLLEELQREWFFHRDPSAEIWTGLYGEKQPKLLCQIREDCQAEAANEEDIQQARDWLRALRWTRTARDRQRWTRQQLKRRVLWLSAVVVSVTVAAAFVAAGLLGGEWKALGVSVSAGALGAGVSGTYRLRDEVQQGRAVREFRATMFAQLAVGAAAGLVVGLVIESGLIRLGQGQLWTTQAVAAFVAGFSEAYFRGIVGRVGSSGNDRAERRETSRSVDGPRSR